VEVLYYCEFLQEPEQNKYKSKWNIIGGNVFPHLYSDFSFGNIFVTSFKKCHPGDLVSMPPFGRCNKKN
jgi:hypothetical protein